MYAVMPCPERKVLMYQSIV